MAFSTRIAKTNSIYYLDNIFFNFYYKDKSISLFDINIYPLFPFSTSFYLRGIKILDKKYSLAIGKQRDGGEIPPSFKRNDYFLSGEFNFYNKFPFEFKTSFLTKKDIGNPLIFALSNSFTYTKNNFDFEKRIGFSIMNYYFGFADEMRFSFTKEERGFNLIFRGKTRNYSLFYDGSKDYYVGFSGTGFSKINQYMHGILRLSYFRYIFSWDFLNDYEMNFSFPSFPSFTLSSGIEGRKKFFLKRGIEISYNKKFFYLRASHSKGLREVNDLRLEMRKYPISSEFYSIFSRIRLYRFSLKFSLRKFISLEIFSGKEKKERVKNFYGAGIRFNYSKINFLTSYYLTQLNEKSYSTLSLSISGAVMTGKLGFGRCYGLIYMDENGNMRYDPGEKGVKGMRIILDGEKEVITDERGRFNITFLEPGKHFIEIRYGALPAEYGSGVGEKFGFDVGIFGIKNFSIPIVPLGEVEGYVFIDKNGNGKKDKEEEGVKNAVVIINGSSTITDEEGRFYITALPPGIYNVEIGSLPIKNVSLPSPLSLVVGPGEKIKNIHLPVTLPEKKIKYKKF